MSNSVLIVMAAEVMLKNFGMEVNNALSYLINKRITATQHLCPSGFEVTLKLSVNNDSDYVFKTYELKQGKIVEKKD
mgnify:CR=1 FL=1